MLQVVQAYCLICKGVRIIVSNQNKPVMATTGTESIKDNIISVFGKKQMDELVEIRPALSEGASFTEETLLDEDDPNSSLDVSVADIDRLNSVNFEIEGYISSCRPGCGRSAKDRQFFYINDRPCDFGHISKVVNEVYHKYNASQMPFVLLNIKLQRSEVDVNITPDKRQLMVNNEKLLLLALKKSLLHTLGPLASTYRMQNVSVASFCLPKPVVERGEDDEEDEDDGAGPNILKFKPSGSKFSEKLLQWQHSGLGDEVRTCKCLLLLLK
jgi:DNA mismatch repair protein PMS2